MNPNINTTNKMSKQSKYQVALAALNQPRKNKIPAGEWSIYNCDYSFKQFEVSYLTAEENKNADFSKLRYTFIKLSDLVEFIEKDGGRRLGQDDEGKWVQQKFTPENIQKYVLGNKHEVCERYLNAGKGEAFDA